MVCAAPRRPVRESKEPSYMENGSVLGSLLISWCASRGEALSIRTLPLIIHKARRIKVCTHNQQMVIKSCVLFYRSFLFSRKISALLLLSWMMATMLIRNIQTLVWSIPLDLMIKTLSCTLTLFPSRLVPF